MFTANCADEPKRETQKETVGQFFSFARSASDEGAVVHVLELSKDVGAEGFDVAGDPGPERCDRCPVGAREFARRP